MNERARHVIETLTGALAIGAICAALSHGDYWSLIWLIWFDLGSVVVLLLAGLTLYCRRRTRHIGARTWRLAAMVFLALPVALIVARGVVPMEIWKAKRYVAAQLAPGLEKQRAARGRYPAQLDLWSHPPADAPWLIRRFHYSSKDESYTLWVMDPGVCGRVTTYSSVTKQWTESYEPCWY